jgi:predicted Zn-dependent peptidase
MAERYFGPMAARPLPPPVTTMEPPQPGPKTIAVDMATQPLALIGYKRPDELDKDDPVFDIIALILSSGRTGLLYKDLVRDKRLALQAQAIATLPSGRYPNLFAFFLVPGQGHSIEENEKALDDLLTAFKATKSDQETMARVRTKARAAVIRRLGNNSGLASLLATYYARYGDWRKLFTSIDDLNKVTADDVQRVAQKYFVPASRTAAYIQLPRQPQRPATGGGQ